MDALCFSKLIKLKGAPIDKRAVEFEVRSSYSEVFVPPPAFGVMQYHL